MPIFCPLFKENTRKWTFSKSSVLAIRAYWIQVKLKSIIFVAINVIALSQVKLLARHTVKRGVINATYMKCHTFFPKGIPLKVTLKASARKMYFLACKDDMIFGNIAPPMCVKNQLKMTLNGVSSYHPSAIFAIRKNIFQTLRHPRKQKNNSYRSGFLGMSRQLQRFAKTTNNLTYT